MIWLIIGSITTTILAGLHSYIGEIKLLQPLLARPDLPLGMAFDQCRIGICRNFYRADASPI